MNESEKKSICFTGKLHNFGRNEAQALARKAGFQIADGVSQRLDYLVMADLDSTSGKAKKARKYGIAVISEEQFIEMIGQKKSDVEEQTEYRKTHKEIKDLTWQRLAQKVAKKLGIHIYSEAEKDSYDLKTNGYTQFSAYFCVDPARRYHRIASSFLWNRYLKKNDPYSSREEAFHAALNSLFTRNRYDRIREEQEEQKIFEHLPTIVSECESANEMKLKLEIAGWDIFDERDFR